MEIGSKIKNARLYKKMTQAQLCGDYITRNMLSAIENNRALPSLPALEYFSQKLEISASYFFSNDNDPMPYILEYKLPKLRKLAEEKKHQKLLKSAEEFKDCSSNELKLLVANAYFDLGKESFISGDTDNGIEFFNKSEELYRHLGIEAMTNTTNTALRVASALKSGAIPSPFEVFRHNKSTPDFVFYIYIIYMIDHGMADRASSIYDTVKLEYQPYKYHINSRLAAAKINYERAKELLSELVFDPSFNLPVPMMKIFLSELEDYCLKTGDFKTAYQCTKQKEEFKIQ